MADRHFTDDEMLRHLHLAQQKVGSRPLGITVYDRIAERRGWAPSRAIVTRFHGWKQAKIRADMPLGATPRPPRHAYLHAGDLH